MQIADITSILPELFSALFFVTAAFLFFRNPVLTRHLIWERFSGKRLEFSNSDIRAAVTNQRDLNQARAFFPGCRFNNIYHLKAVIAWCNINRVGQEEIRGLSNYLSFDGSEVSLSKESKNPRKVFSIVLALVFSVVGYVPLDYSLRSWLDHGVVAYGVYTKTRFMVMEDKAVEISRLKPQKDLWHITSATCKAKNRVKTSLNEAEYDSICNSLVSGKITTFVESQYRPSLIAFLFLSTLFISLFIACIGEVFKINRFHALRDRLSLPDST